jgi:hypothetical protein
LTKPQEKPLLMICAFYRGDSYPALNGACLGIRFGTPDEVKALERRLFVQVKSRFDDLFDGMKPKQVKQIVDVQVYSTKPSKRGFPTWQGETYWYY